MTYIFTRLFVLLMNLFLTTCLLYSWGIMLRCTFWLNIANISNDMIEFIWYPFLCLVRSLLAKIILKCVSNYPALSLIASLWCKFNCDLKNEGQYCQMLPLMKPSEFSMLFIIMILQSACYFKFCQWNVLHCVLYIYRPYCLYIARTDIFLCLELCEPMNWSVLLHITLS